MKKVLVSSVFIFLMIFSLPCKAQAEEYCALGTHSAGAELNCYIAAVSADAVATAQGLPEGLHLAESPTEEGKALSLRGSVSAAGHYGFVVTVSEEPEQINCSMDIVAAIPVLNVSADPHCAINDSISIEVIAHSADNMPLSYQWYFGSSVEPANAIIGANGPSFSPDTSSPGKFAYCCEVVNVNMGSVAAVVSPAITVTVAEPAISGIEVESLPTKLSFAPGDILDTKGLSLRLNYDNGNFEVIDGGFEASPAQFTSPGKQLVELRYQGFICYYEVDVSLSAYAVEGIGVVTMPLKTEYKLGESLDPNGLSIRAYTANAHFDISEGFSISPEKFSAAGRQTVTVEYAGKQCSFTVNVKDDNSLKAIELASLPIRREYSVGDTLDLSGLSLQLIYGNKTEIISSGYSCKVTELSSPGPQLITVSYAGHSASFSIDVKEAQADSSPSPAPTAGTESPKPTATAMPGVNREHQARELNGLVKVIFVVAFLSLLGLGGYVFYRQKKGKK